MEKYDTLYRYEKFWTNLLGKEQYKKLFEKPDEYLGSGNYHIAKEDKLFWIPFFNQNDRKQIEKRNLENELFAPFYQMMIGYLVCFIYNA